MKRILAAAAALGLSCLGGGGALAQSMTNSPSLGISPTLETTDFKLDLGLEDWEINNMLDDWECENQIDPEALKLLQY